ncbi:plasmid replication protein [Phytobacter diazotrophicus]|jgi:orotate phosphoribosyltransferase-like protein|uniref:Plasmid replication protein n=1 Tax=Phytobacter ursingii TaxID=1972431 RepID=A0AB35RV31_9ENTR|nr:plasmid replication protein [Phytobacter ursingii]AUU93177.1 plasmid replication protein [Enterobacteriaceae bacterium ENNIH3]MDU4154869.1 plasmid replication protein [Enterobacteriaceae bacterium]QIH66822.1 plasmid replication protein [Enterobacteriaceae bacterium A-F18]MDV2865823.1 plasmid replication protein [Phytobacter ursingii]VTP13884.1 orotate phosphoribosyltransferase-like protein [Phytobacter ursingii]
MRVSRNGLTQEQLAEKFNISITTVKKYTAIDREEYESRAKERRLKAYTMRSNGFSLDEITFELNCSYNAAVTLIKRYKNIDIKKYQWSDL